MNGGERQRGERQLGTIHDQIYAAQRAARERVEAPAEQALAAALVRLHFSDPRLDQLLRSEASEPQARSGPSGATVCADMKGWAASGYRVLPADSRSFEAEQAAGGEGALAGYTLRELLKPYEGPRERTLVRRTRALEEELLERELAGLRHQPSLRRALGEAEGFLEERERAPVLGHGTTAAGTQVTVRVESTKRTFARNCRHSVSVEFSERRGGRGRRRAGILSSSSSSSLCVSARSRETPGLDCGNNVQSISIAVPGRVTAVRLQLSDGRAITSRVIVVPRKYGGPAGIYAQALRGFSFHPVSLTELDRSGHAVRVERFAHDERCGNEPRFSGPRFVNLARGKTLDGDPFTIEAAIAHFPRHETSFSLYASIDVPYNDRVDEEAESAEIILGAPRAKPKAYPWSLSVNCPPDEYELIYGILAAPGDTVLARTAAGLVALSEVPLVRHLHSGGPLVYGIFDGFPSELIVERADGSTLYSESLAKRAHDHAEFCAGFAEPA